ncbi:hypothetical protein NKH77_15440 [Streptomyces sp. M19]
MKVTGPTAMVLPRTREPPSITTLFWMARGAALRRRPGENRRQGRGQRGGELPVGHRLGPQLVAQPAAAAGSSGRASTAANAACPEGVPPSRPVRGRKRPAHPDRRAPASSVTTRTACAANSVRSIVSP